MGTAIPAPLKPANLNIPFEREHAAKKEEARLNAGLLSVLVENEILSALQNANRIH
jgi:hypothetical protein